ncbi:MAG TPA: fatty acid-binding protein DegV [Ruminococcaceae bacterium]|nr:fatty acid-binding protein DegV [Oscillospiraceae bacterium]
MKYVFMTDASCDLTVKQVEECGVKVLPMEFQIGENIYQHYPDCRMMKLDEFYNAIKDGAVPKTTQINFDYFKNYFEPYLKAGKDILFTGISTGLSGTYNTCLIAVNELKEKYPDRRIEIIDSRCDSAGLGFLVYLAGKKYTEGASIDELKQYIESTRDKVCHWFVVDDLDLLKKGGRISALTATFGKALQIKPLIGADEIGTLVNVGKIRGKSNIIPTLVKYAKRDADKNSKKQVAFVAHADNIDGAKELRKAVKGMFKEVQICDIGPVIGSHVGSGMLAIVFLGNRNCDA